MATVEQLLSDQKKLLEDLQETVENYRLSSQECILVTSLLLDLNALEHQYNKMQEIYKALALKCWRKKDIKEAAENTFMTFENIYMHFKYKLQNETDTLAQITPVIPDDINHINLKFSGKYEDWQMFCEMFSSIVHNNENINNNEKLFILRNALSGEALIFFIQISVANYNYEAVWSALSRRYSSKRHYCDSFLGDTFAIKPIQKQSAIAIKQLLDTTCTSLKSLQNMGIDTKCWDVVIVYIVVAKLDSETKRDWELNLNSFTNDLPTWDQLHNYLRMKCRALEEANISFTQQSDENNIGQSTSEESDGYSEEDEFDCLSIPELKRRSDNIKQNDQPVGPIYTPEFQVINSTQFLKEDLTKHVRLYNTPRPRRGLVLIFSCTNFEGNVEQPRPDVAVDNENLKILFSAFGYKVLLFPNPTRRDVLDKLKALRREHTSDLEGLEALFVVVSSHGHQRGSDTYVRFSDGLHLGVKQILHYFNNRNLPTLRGVPKVFIFQTCRGQSEDYVWQSAPVPLGEPSYCATRPTEQYNAPTEQNYASFTPTAQYDMAADQYNAPSYQYYPSADQYVLSHQSSTPVYQYNAPAYQYNTTVCQHYAPINYYYANADQYNAPIPHQHYPSVVQYYDPNCQYNVPNYQYYAPTDHITADYEYYGTADQYYVPADQFNAPLNQYNALAYQCYASTDQYNARISHQHYPSVVQYYDPNYQYKVPNYQYYAPTDHNTADYENYGTADQYCVPADQFHAHLNQYNALAYQCYASTDQYNAPIPLQHYPSVVQYYDPNYQYKVPNYQYYAPIDHNTADYENYGTADQYCVPADQFHAHLNQYNALAYQCYASTDQYNAPIPLQHYPSVVQYSDPNYQYKVPTYQYYAPSDNNTALHQYYRTADRYYAPACHYKSYGEQCHGFSHQNYSDTEQNQASGQQYDAPVGQNDTPNQQSNAPGGHDQIDQTRQYNTTSEQNNAAPIQNEVPADQNAVSAEKHDKSPLYSDILIAHSTLPGFVSRRDPQTGSWYIKVLCEVFAAHAHNCHVEKLFTLVDDRLKELFKVQTSSIEKWGFNKRLYLYPGLLN